MAGTHTFTVLGPEGLAGPRGCAHCACVLLPNGRYKENPAATEELDRSRVESCPAAAAAAVAPGIYRCTLTIPRGASYAGLRRALWRLAQQNAAYPPPAPQSPIFYQADASGVVTRTSDLRAILYFGTRSGADGMQAAVRGALSRYPGNATADILIEEVPATTVELRHGLSVNGYYDSESPREAAEFEEVESGSHQSTRLTTEEVNARSPFDVAKCIGWQFHNCHIVHTKDRDAIDNTIPLPSAWHSWFDGDPPHEGPIKFSLVPAGGPDGSPIIGQKPMLRGVPVLGGGRSRPQLMDLTSIDLDVIFPPNHGIPFETLNSFRHSLRDAVQVDYSTLRVTVYTPDPVRFARYLSERHARVEQLWDTR